MLRIETHQEDKENKERKEENSMSMGGGGVLTRQTSKGAKINCLCSPTTHAGSFRCRFHRAHNSTNASFQRIKSIDTPTILRESPPAPKATNEHEIELPMNRN
ncbi:hypothetical protein C5167_034540 [Papaver somniferum]|uniref:Uncharacterized protein n=1 Tax=Papaver somniferum TaxID=3469 RepID=A0A4Y7KER7_PAPSO|nr:uncharacterized protein LOC113293324 [Papaver somniferum]RZC71336.1 hypothetical protein C5167_034540 [Papaver somniferum]